LQQLSEDELTATIGEGHERRCHLGAGLVALARGLAEPAADHRRKANG
jgi:hypothetical protein